MKSRYADACASVVAFVLVLAVPVLVLSAPLPTLAGERTPQEAVEVSSNRTATQTGTSSSAEQAVAKSLKEAIRDSAELGLFTKLRIKSRFDQVTKASRRFQRGQIPEYDLRFIFESAFRWLERTVADDDPALQVQLVQARPVLLRLALAR